MRSKVVMVLAVIAASTAVQGCGGEEALVRANAASDLRCEDKNLDVSSVAHNWTVVGCGGSASYTCSQIGGQMTCIKTN